MVLLVYGLATWALPPLLGGVSSFMAALITLLVAGGAGAALYVALSVALRVEALDFFLAALRQRLRRGRS
jgi:hypothetical protein